MEGCEWEKTENRKVLKCGRVTAAISRRSSSNRRQCRAYSFLRLTATPPPFQPHDYYQQVKLIALDTESEITYDMMVKLGPSTKMQQNSLSSLRQILFHPDTFHLKRLYVNARFQQTYFEGGKQNKSATARVVVDTWVF